MNYALQVAYDGTDFTGFQQTHGVQSVQVSLQTVLEKLLKQKIKLICAGRTDSGVHAYGQVVGFQADIPLELDRLVAILNQRLPQAIAIKAIWQVPDTFHARFSACARHYRYIITHATPRDPFVNRYAWEYPYTINADLLKTAWRCFEGRHDFQAFAKSSSSHQSSYVHIWLTEIQIQGSLIFLDVIAERFLYSMVRQMVGSSLDIARGHLPLDHLETLFNKKTTYKGLCAPAQGLFFCRPLYAPEFGIQIACPEPWSVANQEKIPSEFLHDPGKWWSV